jgi:hypothetical protein
MNERHRPIAFALDLERLRLIFDEREETMNVLFDGFGERGLGGTVETLANGERQADRSIRRHRANRCKLREPHQQGANQADGIGILNDCTSAHYFKTRYSSEAPIPPSAPLGKWEGHDSTTQPQGLPSLPEKQPAVMPRGLPGAIALGLLASLVAHAAIFGGDHAMGGAYNEVLVQTAIAACVGLVASFGTLAWVGRGRASDGSVLASRLSQHLPDFPMLFASSAAWYTLAEALEPHHAPASALVILIALASAAFAILLGARGLLRTLAKAVLAIAPTDFSPRSPAWVRRPQAVPVVRRSPLLRRRFARPPPIAVRA